jgi:dTDP-4-dehydrorhamnose reductase
MHPLVVITGKTGQLGMELKQLVVLYNENFRFLLTDRNQLDLSVPETIEPFFRRYKPSFFINCAAYTAVDKAEKEKDLALTINGRSVGVLAEYCEKYGTKLITISTDYVFKGDAKSPYKTTDPTDPINYYGYTKSIGEFFVKTNNPSAIIIRTSWVYSTYGNNFVKTMLRLMADKPEIRVVSDQIGSPTYAADLAAAIMHLIRQEQYGNKQSGIYHYSNTGVISWYDFALAIRDGANFKTNIIAIPSSDFPTPAKRPAYSVMDTESFATDFRIELKEWGSSLKKCLLKLKT